MCRVIFSVFALALLLLVAPASAESAGFTTNITGDLEATVEGPGALRCKGMGDMGPGYLDLRNGHRTDKIWFSMPIDVQAGEYEITSWTRLAADKAIGKGYSLEISMPLKRFHKAVGASGTLELAEVGKKPGERVKGTFDVTSDSMGTKIRLQGSFDFIVPEDAREEC